MACKYFTLIVWANKKSFSSLYGRILNYLPRKYCRYWTRWISVWHVQGDRQNERGYFPCTKWAFNKCIWRSFHPDLSLRSEQGFLFYRFIIEKKSTISTLVAKRQAWGTLKFLQEEADAAPTTFLCLVMDWLKRGSKRAFSYIHVPNDVEDPWFCKRAAR